MRETVKIVNRRQATLYIKNGLKPIDVYASKGKDGELDILVYVFDKESTFPLFIKWCNGELK